MQRFNTAASGVILSLVAVGLLAAGCGGEVQGLVDCEAADGVEVVCGFENPEDLAALPGGRWIAVSQMPRMGAEGATSGSLLAWRPEDDRRVVLYPSSRPLAGDPGARFGDPACEGPPAAPDFGPHGIDVVTIPGGPTRIAVVSHGVRDSIEFFDFGFSPDGPVAQWVGCIETPEGVWPNDVVLLPSGEVIVSKMMSGTEGIQGFLDMLRMTLGLDTGFLLTWRPGGEWREIEGTRGVAPNGVAATPDGAEVYFSEWGGERLVQVSRHRSGPPTLRSTPLPHRPDNLSWTADGRLLVAGQVGDVADLLSCSRVKRGACPLAFSVVRVDPSTLATEVILEHPGTATGAASSALALGDDLYIGSFVGDRVGRAPYRP